MTESAKEPAPTYDPNQPVVAGPGQYYRNTRYLMTLILVGMGLWFGYDGFKHWPEENRKYAALETLKIEARRRGDLVHEQQFIQQQTAYKTHSDTDILLQKILCFVLPPLGFVVLLRALHNSRGEYRLDGQILNVPGHPPVPFEYITELDRHLWDRKGIAFVNYDLGNGQQGRLRLDDFVYDRDPTDEIFNRVEAYVAPQAAQPDANETAASDTSEKSEESNDKTHG